MAVPHGYFPMGVFFSHRRTKEESLRGKSKFSDGIFPLLELYPDSVWSNIRPQITLKQNPDTEYDLLRGRATSETMVNLEEPNQKVREGL